MKFIKDLFKEKGKWSLSRFSFVVMLGIAIKVAVSTGDVPTGLVSLLGMLLAYAFGSKTKYNNLINTITKEEVQD